MFARTGERWAMGAKQVLLIAVISVAAVYLGRRVDFIKTNFLTK